MIVEDFFDCPRNLGKQLTPDRIWAPLTLFGKTPPATVCTCVLLFFHMLSCCRFSWDKCASTFAFTLVHTWQWSVFGTGAVRSDAASAAASAFHFCSAFSALAVCCRLLSVRSCIVGFTLFSAFAASAFWAFAALACFHLSFSRCCIGYYTLSFNSRILFLYLNRKLRCFSLWVVVLFLFLSFPMWRKLAFESKISNSICVMAGQMKAAALSTVRMKKSRASSLWFLCTTPEPCVMWPWFKTFLAGNQVIFARIPWVITKNDITVVTTLFLRDSFAY